MTRREAATTRSWGMEGYFVIYIACLCSFVGNEILMVEKGQRNGAAARSFFGAKYSTS
jgi:hypothetical protein